ncbi:hypothetical protein D3C80_667350 [compost metagenome]
MKTTLLFGFFISLINFTQAQDLDAYKLSGGLMVNDKKYVTYDKLPFFKESFLKGKIVTDKGKVISPVNLRFDMYANELQFIKDKRIYLVSEPVNEFVLYQESDSLNSTFIFRRYKLDVGGKEVPAFCEVLYDGETKLLKYVKRSETEKVNMTSATTVKTFIDYEVAYLQKGKDGKPIKLDKNGKNLLPLLSDKAQQVNEYVKTNRIKLNNEEQLVSLLKYYDSL